MDENTVNKGGGGILDPEVIASLRELSGDDDPDIFAELVELFLIDTPERIASLQAALRAGDANAMEQAAHALKSSCANLGALGLSGLFREIELHGRQVNVDAAAPLVGRSVDEFERVESALRAEIA